MHYNTQCKLHEGNKIVLYLLSALGLQRLVLPPFESVHQALDVSEVQYVPHPPNPLLCAFLQIKKETIRNLLSVQ